MRKLFITLIVLLPALAVAGGSKGLWKAAINGDTEKVMQILDSGGKIHAHSRKGGTLLHVAIKHDHIDLLKALLERHPNVNIRNKKGVTPLFLAAKLDHKEMVQLLLSKGADRDIETDSGKSPHEVSESMENTNVEYIFRNSPKVAATVVVQFIDKKVSQEDFNKFAPKVLKEHDWQVTALDDQTFQGDQDTAFMHLRVNVSLKEEYVMFRYILGYNFDSTAKLEDLSLDFKKLAGI